MANYTEQLTALLGRLNEYQKTAVNVGEGQACVVGVPGSGKTTTIVARIARLVADGLAPEYILAMTFTRAAAAEMTERLRKLGIQGARVGTIHSVCRQIVAMDTDLFVANRLDEKGRLFIELKRILTDLRRARRIPERGVDLEGVLRFISACKARGLCYVHGDPFHQNVRSEGQIGVEAECWYQDAGISPPKLVHLYLELEQRRALCGLHDYDDMLLWAWMQLATSEESRLKWRHRWSVVIVDETQDSNPVQWDIARLLVGLESCIPCIGEASFSPKRDDGGHNLMTAGDSSQSIYRFRHAEPSLFVKYWHEPDVQSLVLPVNYRSNSEICSVATHLVEGKEWHLGGTILPSNPEPVWGKVKLKHYAHPEDEARQVLDEALEIARDDGLKSCAVLARLRISLDLVEIECVRKRIRYIKLARGSFLESSECRDILGYIRVAAGYDAEGKHLRHIINRPFRFIGKTFITEAEVLAEAKNVSLLDAMIELQDALNGRQRAALTELYEILIELSQIAATAEEIAAKKYTGEDEPQDVADMIRIVIEKTDYVEKMRREVGLLGLDESKLAILGELHRIASMFNTAREFLIYVDGLAVALEEARRSGLRLREDSQEDALTISTIHSAKGLEFRHVFLTDVVSDRFPHRRADDYDEELRLLYVAVTRAIDTCTVSYSGPHVDDALGGERPSSFTILIRDEIAKAGCKDKPACDIIDETVGSDEHAQHLEETITSD